MKIAFTIPGQPKTTAQQKGVMVRAGRAMFFTKKNVNAEKSRLMTTCLLHQPTSPMQGPLTVKLVFTWPFTIAEARKHRSMKDSPCFTLQKTTRPDVDNCAKALLDVMTQACFWADDSQISTLILCKQSGWMAGISVEVSEAF